MDLQERIKMLVKLGNYMLSNDEEWINIKERSSRENAWFTNEFVEIAANNISNSFLQEDLLQNWVEKYEVKDYPLHQKNIGIVMAGNIPLVGFHDFLCVFICGYKQTIKASSKDNVLIKHLVSKLAQFNEQVNNDVKFAENLKGCDAYIATGSNNSSRYFDYYFGKYPSIIRKNRTSVAVLTGNESEDDLALLSDDIQMYFGLGCRNVTKLYVPVGYDFQILLDTLKKYGYYFEFHKYKHNYDYQLALQMMGRKFYMTNDSIILVEEPSLFSPVSQVNYEFYTDKESLICNLSINESIQCIVGEGFVSFGAAQKPTLLDYADGLDTMKFINGLK